MFPLNGTERKGTHYSAWENSHYINEWCHIPEILGDTLISFYKKPAYEKLGLYMELEILRNYGMGLHQSNSVNP